MRASKETRLGEFFDLLRIIWNDRFPFPLPGEPGFNADISVWERDIHRKRTEYISKARLGVRLHGHQYEVVLSAEERRYLAMTPEQAFQALLTDMEDAYWHNGSNEMGKTALRLMGGKRQAEYETAMVHDLLRSSTRQAIQTTTTQAHTTYEAASTGENLTSSRTYIQVPAAQPSLVSPSTSAGLTDYELVGSDTDNNWVDPNDIDSDNPLGLWESDLDLYLSEMMRLEGPGDAAVSCVDCVSAKLKAKITETQGSPPDNSLYRCVDCVDCLLRCKHCIVDKHSALPLHQVEKWDGLSFTRTTLKQLGLFIQLGHTDGSLCSSYDQEEGFVILHVNGLHLVDIRFCGCSRIEHRYIQVLRSRLFPATTIYPKSAATFELLRTFQVMSFMTKISVFEFYQTLVRLTDNGGTEQLPDRYVALLRMIREWWHLKMLKRAGRGYYPDSSRGTAPGECAVLCPACPLPRLNLPVGWERAPLHISWLYALFVGIDANFCLKRLNNSTQEKDPGLNRGHSYFVKEGNFKHYLEEFGPRIADDISTCNNHDAIKSASIQGGKGVEASGVGKTECARHDMKRPLSIGDLQKGERTDGEAPERGWAAVNAVASSTEEMGPGARRDTLDDHFADYNWRKIISLPSTFLRKAVEAIKQREEQVTNFLEFDSAFPEEDARAWTSMVQAWEADPSQPNPFVATVAKITENAICLELALEDEARLREDLTSVIHDDVPPSRLIAQGLELEDHQRLLRLEIKGLGAHSTSLQRSKAVERSNRLFWKIEAWMTSLHLAEEQLVGDDHIPTADVSLYLPSAILGKAACDPKLQDIEWRLCYAQAHETLHDIRRAILLRSQMYKTKNILVRGQAMNTRSQALIKTVTDRIDNGIAKYNEIRQALVTLSTVLDKGGWASVLRELTPIDVVGIMAVEDHRAEGSRTISWI
ncbi:hypothetical protein DXG01_000902 [Tephrocybe rancida]|nr:hypothetical protein DXG01_000902 [Tephrocybe rancida]